MKSLKRIFISFTIFMLLILILFYTLNRKTVYGKRDIVFYNDQLHKVSSDIESGMSEADVEDKYSCHIIYAKEIDDPEL